MELKHLFFSIEEIPVIHKVTKFRQETEEKVYTVLHTTNSINSGADVQKTPSGFFSMFSLWNSSVKISVKFMHFHILEQSSNIYNMVLKKTVSCWKRLSVGSTLVMVVEE